MEYLSFKSFKKQIDPVSLFEVFKDKKGSFLLYSGINPYGLGRYSFMGFDPFMILRSKAKQIQIIEQDRIKESVGNPLSVLRTYLNKYKIKNKVSNIPFLAGAVGYIGYDFGFLLEDIKQKTHDDLGLWDSFFGLYDTTICYDHLKKELSICSLGLPEKNLYLRKLYAESKIQKIIRAISNPTVGHYDRNLDTLTYDIRSNFIKESYISSIKKAKEYIRRGDIYQINLSQRFEAQTQRDDFDLFKDLVRISPSAFCSFFNTGDFSIISSSPETFLKTNDKNMVYTRPMKGTRPRGKTAKEDAILKNELLKSAKDKAELMMIVDLLRNDLGRVCSYGSVKVNSLRNLERYSTVFQTTASIEGKLHKNKDRIDLIKACFPGGSVTGCPKIRAMEIIEELEPTKRSIYTGSLGYLDFSGNMELNILIRTILKKKDKLYFQVGGGIVSDSIPEDEYEETLTKARAIFKTLDAKKTNEAIYIS